LTVAGLRASNINVMYRRTRLRSFASSILPAILAIGFVQTVATVLAQQPETSSAKPATVSAMHQAARTGDTATLRAELQRGTSPNARDTRNRTPLMDAAAAGQLEAIRVLLSAGAKVNARAADNRTPLIEAAAGGHLEAARLLVESGAHINTPERGWGTPLETAERNGHTDITAMLRAAGARSSGRSPGDTVCVLPWAGEGYCGKVESVNKTQFRIRVTRIVGCKDGCPARAECSAGRAVGGPDGLRVGDSIATVSWCLTRTGVPSEPDFGSLGWETGVNP
jgi:hypothetical protein